MPITSVNQSGTVSSAQSPPKGWDFGTRLSGRLSSLRLGISPRSQLKLYRPSPYPFAVTKHTLFLIFSWEERHRRRSIWIRGSRLGEEAELNITLGSIWRSCERAYMAVISSSKIHFKKTSFSRIKNLLGVYYIWNIAGHTKMNDIYLCPQRVFYLVEETYACKQWQYNVQHAN